MLILIVGNFRKLPSFFAALDNSRTHSLQMSNPAEYRKILKTVMGEKVLIYLEGEAFTADEIKKEIRFLQRQPEYIFAVFDPKGKTEDPAALFHNGISDYIGKNIEKDAVSIKRVKQIVDFSEKSLSVPQIPAESSAKNNFGKDNSQNCADQDEEKLVPGGDWNKIKKGKSYFFCFMFVELDLTAEWRKKSGQTHLKKVKESFLRYIQNAVSPINGRIWMWNEYGGLVLFPYRSGPCPMVLASCKLMINRAIASCEDFQFKTNISYRIGLHIGETVYQERGKTGTIISDSINFLFHLGQKFAQPGNMYITKQVYDLSHPGLKDLFIEEGVFEDRKFSECVRPYRRNQAPS